MGLQRVGGSGDADSGDANTDTERERERGEESGGRVPQYRCRISTETGLITGISDFSEDVPLARCEKTYESRLRESAVPLVSPFKTQFRVRVRDVVECCIRAQGRFPAQLFVLSSDPYCAFESLCLRGIFEGSINSKPQNLNPRPSSLKA